MAATATQRLVRQFEMQVLKDAVAFLNEEQWDLLLTYYIDVDALQKALTALTYAIAQHAYSTDFWVLKAQVHYDLAEPRACIEAAERAEQLGVRSLGLYLLRADAYTDIKDYTEALGVLHDALGLYQKDKSLAAIYTHIANIYEEQKRYDKVFETLRLAAQHNPNANEILDRLGAIVRQLKNYAQSIVAHQQILDTQPYATRAWHNLGAAHAGLNEPEAAIEAYEYALTIEENYFAAAIGLAQIWLGLGLYERALLVLSDVTAAADTDIIDADVYYWQAFTYFKMEQYKTAKRFADTALLRDDTHHAAHFLLGEMATMSAQWQQALHHYKKSTAYANANGDYWAAYAHALMRNEQPETAMEAFQYAIKTDPQNLDYWLGIINAHLVLEDFEAAHLAIIDAESFIDLPQLGYCKTVYYFLTRRRKAALQTLQHTLAMDLPNADYLFDLMPSLVKDPEVLRLIQAAQQAAKRKR
jgi:tetratricopeptide (TPR) repeat protein